MGISDGKVLVSECAKIGVSNSGVNKVGNIVQLYSPNKNFSSQWKH